jgi:hypothetical protein
MTTQSCLICLEDTSTFVISYNCSCKIYTHLECIQKYFEQEGQEKCMICKISYEDHHEQKNEDNEEKEEITYKTIFFKMFNRFIRIIECECEDNLLVFLIISFLISIFIILPLFFLHSSFMYFTEKRKDRMGKRTENFKSFKNFKMVIINE